MKHHLLRLVLACVALPLFAGCGDPGARLAESAAASAAREVAINGVVTAPGTKGALLVFALAGADEDPAGRETLSVAAVGPDGAFAFTTPPAADLSLGFLADGSNDGAIDGGDPVAVLSGPSFANLQGGETVTLTDVSLDFTTRKAGAAAIDVRRAGGAESTRTPTPIPASR